MVAAAAAAELVLLTACGSTVEASVLRGLLESSGIFSYVQGENHRALLHLASAIELRLLVRRADLADARAARGVARRRRGRARRGGWRRR
jgi:hypothetical protein